MLLGIISDTHDDLDVIDRALELFQKYGVDEVIHLGDLVSPFALKPFINSGIPTTLFRGNNDAEALTAVMALKEEVNYMPAPALLERGESRILAFHGFGPKDLTKLVAIKLAETGQYDFVIYGHTHEVHLEDIGKTKVLNPGEACGKLTGKRTVALLDTYEKSAEILEL